MKNLLIFVYCTFILFLVGSAVYASKTFDGDIANAYEKGMAYPKELAKLKEKGWTFTVMSPRLQAGKPSEIDLMITDKAGQPVTGVEVELELSRLTMPETLPAQTAVEGEKGHYVLSVTLPQYGHWQVQTKATHDADEIKHLFEVYAEEGAIL